MARWSSGPRGQGQGGHEEGWPHLAQHRAPSPWHAAWLGAADAFARRLVEDRLDQARWQLAQVPAAERAPLRYAACFVVPALTGPASAAPSVLDAASDGLLQGETALARHERPGDPLAEQRWDGLRYPAVMLVVRRVR